MYRAPSAKHGAEKVRTVALLPGPPEEDRPAVPFEALEAPPPPVDAGEEPETDPEPDPLEDGPAIGVVVDEPPGGTTPGGAGEDVTG